MVSLPIAGAQQAALQGMEGGVYVAWGFEGTPEQPPYGDSLRVSLGSSGCYTVGVWNTLSMTIRNVTLTIHPQRDAVTFGFEASAGDDPDLPYAFWREIEGNGTALACLHVFPGKDARVIDSLAVARFELEDGTEAVARWPKSGEVEPPSRNLPALSLAGITATVAVGALKRR